MLLYVYYYCTAKSSLLYYLIKWLHNYLIVNCLYCIILCIALYYIFRVQLISIGGYCYPMCLRLAYIVILSRLYIYIYFFFHVIINIIDIILCMLKTVNIINFVYIRPTAQLGLNKSSIYLSISLFLSFEFRWAFGKQVGCTRALSLYPRASLRASQLPWDSDSGRIVRGSEGSESVREREREVFPMGNVVTYRSPWKPIPNGDETGEPSPRQPTPSSFSTVLSLVLSFCCLRPFAILSYSNSVAPTPKSPPYLVSLTHAFRIVMGNVQMH